MLIVMQLMVSKILGRNIYMHSSAGFKMKEKCSLALKEVIS